MSDSSRTPPTLIVSIAIIVLAVGVAAYYMGRFGRSAPKHAPEAVAELPEPGAPVPDAAQPGTTRIDVPPTVTPSIPVVVEKGRRTGVSVERSSQIVVPVAPAPPVVPTPVLGTMQVAPTPAGRRIVVEVRPTPTPLPPPPPQPELQPPPPPAPPELQPPPPPVDTPVPRNESPEENPEPEPEPTQVPRS